MSFKLQQACLYIPLKDASAKFVLVALADFTDEEGNNARPSIGRIVFMTSLSKSTVKRSLKVLQEFDLIELISGPRQSATRKYSKTPAGGRGKTSEYRLNAKRIYDLAEEAKAEKPWLDDAS